MKIVSHDSTGNKTPIDFDSFTFSGGEEHIRFNPMDFATTVKIEIFERLTDSSKLVQRWSYFFRQVSGKVKLQIVGLCYAANTVFCSFGCRV